MWHDQRSTADFVGYACDRHLDALISTGAVRLAAQPVCGWQYENSDGQVTGHCDKPGKPYGVRSQHGRHIGYACDHHWSLIARPTISPQEEE